MEVSNGGNPLGPLPGSPALSSGVSPSASTSSAPAQASTSTAAPAKKTRNRRPWQPMAERYEVTPGGEKYFFLHRDVWRLYPRIDYTFKTIINPNNGKPFATGREVDNLMCQLKFIKDDYTNQDSYDSAIELIIVVLWEFLSYYFPDKVPEPVVRDLCFHYADFHKKVRKKHLEKKKEHLCFVLELWIERRQGRKRARGNSEKRAAKRASLKAGRTQATIPSESEMEVDENDGKNGGNDQNGKAADKPKESSKNPSRIPKESSSSRQRVDEKSTSKKRKKKDSSSSSSESSSEDSSSESSDWDSGSKNKKKKKNKDIETMKSKEKAKKKKKRKKEKKDRK